MDHKPYDLSISGMGKMNGGDFGQVEISGFGRLTGDVSAKTITISGAGTVDGNTKADRIRVSGTGNINGSLEGNFVESTGNFKVEGQAVIGELVNEGRCRMGQTLKAQKVLSQGYLSIGGDLEADIFTSKGSFAVDGLLNANLIEIEIRGFCTAKEIGGEEIIIRKQGKINLSGIARYISPLLGNGRELDKLKCGLIEGTNVQIEHTHARKVSGGKVAIGPDCRIEEVEYSDELWIDSTAWVGTQRKINL